MRSSNLQSIPNAYFHHRRRAEYAEKNNSYLPGDTGKYKTSEQVVKVYDRHSCGLSGVVVNEAWRLRIQYYHQVLDPVSAIVTFHVSFAMASSGYVFFEIRNSLTFCHSCNYSFTLRHLMYDT